MTPAAIRALCQQALLTNSYPIIAPEIILALLDSVEGLSRNHPDNTADCGTLALDHLAAISRVGALEAELESLRSICRETRDTLQVIDEWLGSASTRQAALDSMWRLSRMLQQAGYEYRFKHILDWRGSLVKELNDAGFYNSLEGMRYDPTAADSKPYRVYGNAEGPTLKEVIEKLNEVTKCNSQS